MQSFTFKPVLFHLVQHLHQTSLAWSLLLSLRRRYFICHSRTFSGFKATSPLNFFVIWRLLSSNNLRKQGHLHPNLFIWSIKILGRWRLLDLLEFLLYLILHIRECFKLRFRQFIWCLWVCCWLAVGHPVAR